MIDSFFFKWSLCRDNVGLSITVPAFLLCLAERDFPRIKPSEKNDSLFLLKKPGRRCRGKVEKWQGKDPEKCTNRKCKESCQGLMGNRRWGESIWVGVVWGPGDTWIGFGTVGCPWKNTDESQLGSKRSAALRTQGPLSRNQHLHWTAGTLDSEWD